MLLKSEWAERFLRICAKLDFARRRRLAAGSAVYLTVPRQRCWVVANGYVKILDPRSDGHQFVKLILGRGSLFGDRPFEAHAFGGFHWVHPEQAIAQSAAEVLELDRAELEAASRSRPELASFLIESATSRAQFLERRLLWQLITPIRARLAAALRDLICFEGRRCRHGHTIDVRLTHQDLAEFVGAARPVVSAELVTMRDEGLVEYTRCYFCVDDLAGLDRIASGNARKMRRMSSG